MFQQTDKRHSFKKGYLLDLRKIEKQFDDQKVLDGISFTMYPGEVITLLGASGSGKSTLLRIIAGIEKYDNGSMDTTIDKQDLSFIFQEPRLLPWMTIHANLSLVLRNKVNKKEINQRVEKALKDVYLTGKGDLYPDQLSGGMRQRVAIARALVVNPKLILMDEPFASLDFPLRLELIQLLSELFSSREKGGIFVTHDVREALLVADKILIMAKNPAKIVDIISINIPREERSLNMHSMEKLYYNINNLLLENYRTLHGSNRLNKRKFRANPHFNRQ